MNLADLLTNASQFSKTIIQFPLHRYQSQPIQVILDSILTQSGLEFLIVMPRQSGKNEAIAHLLVMLLNLFQRTGGQIVYGAIGDGLGRGIKRLEDRLDNEINGRYWKKANKPIKRTLGRAAVVFMSSHPFAFSRGETAHHLLIIDEMQDQSRTHIEQVFEPMRASTNATAVYIGTVRTTSDALWLKKQELERESTQDGIQRVFFAYPDDVTAENSLYASFLATKVKRYGRKHPIVASEYFLEPVDAEGGLFPLRRIALMRGNHGRYRNPKPGKSYIIVIDVGGQDEATTDAVAQLNNPGRDYTVATAIEVSQESVDDLPIYTAVDVLVLHGRRHFEESPGNPSATTQLKTYIEHWGAAHTIIDESGIGEAVQSFLALKFPNRVTGQKLDQSSKARLGSNFISVIENGRFQHFRSEVDYDDAWWFYAQATACGYEIPPGGDIEKKMSWGVPESHRTETPKGKKKTHDDRLLSVALIAAADELIICGIIQLGTAKAIIIKPTDPLANLSF